MPVFNFDFNRSVSRINMSAERSGIFTPDLASLELHEAEMERFNAMLRRFVPAQPALTLDQIAGAARRILRAAHKGEESVYVKVRMRRAGELRAALRDARWDFAPALAEDARALLDYIESGVGLIPNDIPVVGLLDDAILMDVAMNRLRGELDEYAEFCRFRVAEAARLDVAIEAVNIDRTRWIEERRQERRLEQQLRRVRGSRYAHSAATENAFRVC